MSARIIITADYHANASDVFRSALDFDELKKAMEGLATYEIVSGDESPAREGQTLISNVTLFGFMKTKNYAMHIERLDHDRLVLQSREHGGAIKQWDHRLSVTQIGEIARWTDDITIDAGLLTFGAARFGTYVYSYRHKKRSALTITTEIK